MCATFCPPTPLSWTMACFHPGGSAPCCSSCVLSLWERAQSGIVSSARGGSGASGCGSCEASPADILCLQSPGVSDVAPPDAPTVPRPTKPSLRWDPGTCTVPTSLVILKYGQVQEPFVYTRESLVCMCRKVTHLLRVQRPIVRLCPVPGLREAWASSPPVSCGDSDLWPRARSSLLVPPRLKRELPRAGE